MRNNIIPPVIIITIAIMTTLLFTSLIAASLLPMANADKGGRFGGGPAEPNNSRACSDHGNKRIHFPPPLECDK
jgi:hypothetical protein